MLSKELPADWRQCKVATTNKLPPKNLRHKGNPMNRENFLAVVANIYGINIVTRNKIMSAINRGDLEAVQTLIDQDIRQEYSHFKPEVKTVIATMLNQVREREAKNR